MRDKYAILGKVHQQYSILIILVFILFMFPETISAAEPCSQWVARIVSIQGTVTTRTSDEARWSPASLNQTYCAGDIVHVGENSRAAIELSNETIIRLDQKTIIVLSEIEKKESSWLEVLKGTIHIITRVPRSLKIKTPYVNAFVEGTEFLIRVEGEQTLVSVIEGQVVVENDLGRLLLASGQSSMTREGEAPVLRLDIRPNDAVHWSLYYPSLLDKHGAVPPDGSTTGATVRYLLVQADALLAVGRAEEAAHVLDQVLELIPDNSTAYAMLSIIALAQNEKDQALELANKALLFHPESVEALIGLSYGLQAHFELEGALQQIEKALQYEPGNALLWARLAELQFSLGDLDQALDAAHRSVELNPQQARSLTVLGFVYLGKFKAREANEIFDKAITFDQADPLPRLGIGLALIREGDLKSGRREIEIAASLDPNNALVRSYLGKAYYEEHRSKLAADQFVISKSLDPMDPTPWFYDAIRKQSENRPVEALFDLQKSVELNDNRAVYRSRFLLDQDLAARSASLARIYNDLGFQQLALAEGWKSVNTDPGNHSAHRFLADSYAVLPRHEIARVSELLQSQLLQPINLNPIQPQLTESNLGILDGAGPSEIAFNEFNPLFVRNRFAFQSNGISGDNDTSGYDLVQSGLWNNFSYSLGLFQYENDGFRENNDQLQDIYNIFAQSALDHKTSVQFEYRKTETDKGDLPLRFNPADFDDTFREQSDSEILRLGIHRQHSSRAQTIVSVLSRDLNIIQKMSNPFFTLEPNSKRDGLIIEIQNQLESKTHSLITGVGSFRADLELNVNNIDTGVTLYNTEDRIRHDNVYVYDQSDYSNDTHITLGLSWNTANDELTEVDQLNPKFGLLWDADEATTIRTAAFRTLKRSLIANQTLEPTQIAGFNQFFDDANSTDAWRYGIAMDKKYSQKLYSGIELSRRDMDVYAIDASTGQTFVADWQEDMGRAYVYWTPNSSVATSLDYHYEYFQRPEEFAPNKFLDLTTHRLPLGISYFNPGGMTINLKATFIKQEGSFFELFPATAISDSDQFWIVDTEVSYRMPKRHGIISIGVKNLFDKEFHFHDTDAENPQIIPDIFVFSRITLSI